MCGIVYSHNFNGQPVNNDILNRFDAQRNRGVDGFGLFTQFKDGVRNLVKEVTEDGILNYLIRNESDLILFHHRYPTSTDNTKRTAHPFTTKDYFGKTQYILVHNGRIKNSYTRKYEHEKLGITYQSEAKKKFNDSEALLWDFALYQEGKQDSMEVVGDIAFICARITDGTLDKLYFARNHMRPLKYWYDNSGLTLASEGKDGESVKVNTLYEFDYANKELSERDCFTLKYWQENKGGYNYEDYEYKGNTCHNFQLQNPHSPVDTYDDHATAGNWLSDELKKKYRKFLPGYSGSQYEYQQNEQTGLYEPIETYDYNEYEDDFGPIMTEAELDELFDTYIPSKADVQALALDYLSRSQGNFEQAYWLLEDDYVEKVNQPDLSKTDMEEVRDMEKALDLIMDDPEYLDQTSVSSIWSALCQ